MKKVLFISIFVSVISLCIKFNYDINKLYANNLTFYHNKLSGKTVNLAEQQKDIEHLYKVFRKIHNIKPYYKETNKYFDQFSFFYYQCEAQKIFETEPEKAKAWFEKAKFTKYAKEHNEIEKLNNGIALLDAKRYMDMGMKNIEKRNYTEAIEQYKEAEKIIIDKVTDKKIVAQHIQSIDKVIAACTHAKNPITNNKSLAQENSGQKEMCQNLGTRISHLSIDTNVPYNIKLANEVDKYYKECTSYITLPHDNEDHYWHLFYFIRGTKQYENKDYLQAISYLKKSLEFNLKTSKKLNLYFDYQYLGDCYFNIGEFSKAKKYYLLAFPLGPKGVGHYEKIGDVYNILGENEEALKYYEKALEAVYQLYNENYAMNRPDVVEWLHQKEQKFNQILYGNN